MKSLFLVLALAALGGCATAPYGQTNYGNQSVRQSGDPSQWHVVSVTPVPPGTGARVAADGGNSASRVEYNSSADQAAASPPVYAPQSGYASQPVYAPQQPLYGPAPGYYYAPAPAYYAPAPYYYPPVSLSLGFMFGNGWGRGGWGRAGFGFRHH